MKLRILRSAQGDCLLLESHDGKLVLCDGGARDSMTGHVRKELARLRDAGRALEFIYVSHIDSDHIAGVLQLLEDEVDWRVYDFQRTTDAPPRPPKVPRPPVIKGILQNSFRDLIGVNLTTDVADLLAAAVPSLFATADPRLVDAGLALQDLAVSIPEALMVSRLTAADALDIPINRLPGTTGPGKLLFFRDRPQTFKVGTMAFTIVGPTATELAALKSGWITWLRENKKTVAKIRREMKARVDAFSAGAADAAPFDLRDWNGIPDYKDVTAPNVASLMFLVEDQGRRLLLTGDSHPDKILHGLRQARVLTDAGVHLDVLKVPHHGSEHNMNVEFARLVSATHLVFCGNGLHGNPDRRAVDLLLDARFGSDPANLALAAPVDAPVHLWFSEAPDPADTAARAAVFRDLAAHVDARRLALGGRLVVHFNTGTGIDLKP